MEHTLNQEQKEAKGKFLEKKYFMFTLYKTGILRTVVETGKRFYPYEN
jgi:hypothetical protein